MTASNALLTLDQLTCRRGGRVLFQNLSLGLSEGDVVHLAGPNGAGKTSLLRLIAGALPFEGGLAWRGEAISENERSVHAARFAYLPANDAHLKVLETSYENLMFWGRLWGIGGDIAENSLSALGLFDLRDRPVRFLSAGQKRRLSLATVIMKGSWLWLLDEPLNGLDIQSAVLFRAALDHHTAKGGAAVIASHLNVEPPATGTLRRVTLGAA